MNNFPARIISFVLILALILVVPASLPGSEVNAAVGDNIVNMANVSTDVEIENNGTNTTASSGGLIIATGDSIVITGNTSFTTTTTGYAVIVKGSRSVNMTLSDAAIDVLDEALQNSYFNSPDHKAAVKIINEASTTITLRGKNTLKSSSLKAGIEKNEANQILNETTPGSLTITGGEYDSLTVTGGAFGAGIGSKCGFATANITISGGNVTAIAIEKDRGCNGGAGIGGGGTHPDFEHQTGIDPSVKNITITGGNVTAMGAVYGAGIGGGYNGSAENITITDGNVNASGSNSAPGIGAGYGGANTKNITISGGNVNATGGDSASGIGGGSSTKPEDIEISGGIVTAVGGLQAAGVGGGKSQNVKNLIISGGFVTAKAGSRGKYDIGCGDPTGLVVGLSPSAISIIGGSVYAVNGKIESPKSAFGTEAYKVTVPALSTPGNFNLKGNKPITVPLGGSEKYEAKTVNNETINEHQLDFPASAAAYIYLPTTSAVSYAGIKVGEYVDGYAEVVQSPALSTQNIVLGLGIPKPVVKEYSITASKSGYGSISPSGNIKVKEGESKAFTIAPNKGYRIKNLVVDNRTISAASKYTFKNVTADHSIKAYFAANKYKFTFNKNKGRTIVGAKSKIVTYNSKVGKLPRAVRTGYKFKGWFTKKSGGTKIASSTKMVFAKNTVLYAHWSKNAKIVNCYTVEVHKKPSKYSKTIKFVKKGTKVCYIKKLKSGWVKVKVGSKTGYVDRRYVKKI